MDENEKRLAMEVAYSTLQEALEGISIVERTLETVKKMVVISSVHLNSLRNQEEKVVE